MKDNDPSSFIKMSIPEGETPKLPENMSKVLVTPLEERAMQRRALSQEILSAFYGSETVTDVWLALQKFDRFVNGESTPAKDDFSEERDQTTRIREISRYLSADDSLCIELRSAFKNARRKMQRYGSRGSASWRSAFSNGLFRRSPPCCRGKKSIMKKTFSPRN